MRTLEENLKKIQSLRKTFCPTPLLEITLNYKSRVVKAYAKSEISTFSGSIKDRMVAHVLEQSYLNGSLQIDDKIIEVTSGCTGIALASLAAFLGHSVEIFIPDWLSKARYSMLEILGANIHKITRQEGGFIKCRELARQKSGLKGYFYLNQFDNFLNIDAHFCSTAPELFGDLKNISNQFILSAGVGTGGTIIGLHKYALKNNINCLFMPMEPASAPLLRSHGQKIGIHRIEGIADDFIPENNNLDLSLFEEIIPIHDGDAILMAQKINQHGFAIGTSSGGNLLATLVAAEKHNFTRVPVTVFPDGSIKYTSTDLFKIEPMREEYLTKDIEVLDIKLAAN
jgi:cysteine synthase A